MVVSVNRVVRLSDADNVLVALEDLVAGESHAGVSVSQKIARGHKLASTAISSGQAVIKYGLPIGRATQDIAPGQHVHCHNMQTDLGQNEFSKWVQPRLKDPDPDLKKAENTVSAFQRGDGRVAIRNEIWILNTVACVNQTATRLAERANRQILPTVSAIDGFHAFPHPFGCSQLGDDLGNTQKILAALINHPHASAVLVLGLGCENNRMAEQLKIVDSQKMERIQYFNTQDVGDEMEQGFEALQQLARRAAQDVRQEVPSSRLVLGMKCGGSDGLSGITANPLLGRIADRHCATGGTVLLTEVPEMFGAESALLSRCQTSEIHRQVCEMVNGFKDYFRSHGQPISENPSPGNHDGGISTLEEKSCGCVQKAGTRSLIKQVVDYGGAAMPSLGGVALIRGPGNDGVSTTALSCAGANIVLFTTGRGTPLGGPVPTMKIATNSTLAQAKPGWIDFNAGQLVDAGKDLDQLADELWSQIVAIGSGSQEAKNECNGYREIAIWKTGVTL